jgi:Arf-GAP/Rho-GAP domain/ANK repeat/PH domain-containing protein 2
MHVWKYHNETAYFVQLIHSLNVEFFYNFNFKGLGCKYIYQKNGDPLHISELLESFKKDARSFKLRAGKHQLEDVTGVLKRFLCDIDDALLTKELYPYWISALGNKYNFEYNKCFLT